MNTKNLVGKKAIVMVDNDFFGQEILDNFEETWHKLSIGDLATILDDTNKGSIRVVREDNCFQHLPLEYLWILD
jgi:hypothetical protein